MVPHSYGVRLLRQSLAANDMMCELRGKLRRFSEKTTARQDQAQKASTRDGAGNSC